MRADMRLTAESCRLLALCGIIIPFSLVYFLKFGVLSAFVLCLILGISIAVLKLAGKAGSGDGMARNFPHESGVRGHAGPSESELVKNSERMSPVRPNPRTTPSLKETEVQQISVHGGTDYDKSGWTMPRKHFPLLSPIPSTVLGPPQSSLSQTCSPSMTPVPRSSGLVLPASPMANVTFTRNPLAPTLISPVVPVKNVFPTSSPQRSRPLGKVPPLPDHSNNAPAFPLSNRHYPTHQPDYARTNMGILPASSIFFGDGAASGSLSPLRREGHVRTHSPVTIKIARPDRRRSASPRFQRLSLEKSSRSPLRKETILAALNERRKRLAVDDQDDDGSSVASSAGGHNAVAKRRRLDDGSRCSTPSLASSSNYSAAANGDADSSADEQTRVRFRSTWMSGLQSRTPRNAIDSSISSSRRAAIAIHMMRKRMLLQPAEPESSPSKKSLVPGGDAQSPHAHQTSESIAEISPEIAKPIGESGSEGLLAASKDGTRSSEDGTPKKTPGKTPGASRLKTPKVKSLGHEMLRNSSPPGEYTAADLEEDRHRATQRVNYILESLRDDEEEETKGQPKDKEPTASVGLVPPLVSAEPATSTSTLTSSNLLQLSKMKTLPVSAVQTGQLLLPSAKTDSVTDDRARAQSTGGPAAGTQQTEAVSQKVSFGTPPTQSSSAAATQAAPVTAATPSSAPGFTLVDSSKSGATAPSVGQAPRKDPLLKGILAGGSQTATGTSVGFGFGGVTAGKSGSAGRAGPGQPAPKQSLDGLLSQGPTVGGFSLGPGAGQPRASKKAVAQTPTAATSLRGSAASTPLFPQSGASGRPGFTSAPASAPPPAATSSAAGPRFQFGTPASVASPVAGASAPAFGSALRGASATGAAPSPFQFGAATPIAQNSTGFPMPSSAPATVVSSGLPFGGATLNTEAQSTAPFIFGSAASTAAQATAPTMSFGSLGGPTGLTSAAAASPAAAVFGGAAAKPSFTPAFGQPVSATPAQPSAAAFNFAAQAQSSGAAPGSFQFKPAFGAPPQAQPAPSQQQSGKQAAFQFGSGATGQPAAAPAGGSFAFGAMPATSSASVFGAGATTAAAAASSPFQSGMSSPAAGVFGQQPATQAPSFGTAAAQATNAFGAPAPGPSVFGSQPAAPAPSAGGFNFGTPAGSQTSSSSFTFGGQVASQPGSAGMFQFGQPAASGGQPASQPMAGFATPSKPQPFNLGAGVSSGFVTPAPSAVPSFGGVTPTNAGGFNMGTGSASNQKRVSRMTQQRRNRRR